MRLNSTIKQLSGLLELADKTASNAAFNLNMLYYRIIVSTEIQKEIDKDASVVKGAINYILQAKHILNNISNSNAGLHLVELWLVKKGNSETDFESPRFVWPFPSLPVAGDKIETLNVIKNLCPGIPDEFLLCDYYKVLYSLFEIDSTGNYYQTIKLTAD